MYIPAYMYSKCYDDNTDSYPRLGARNTKLLRNCKLIIIVPLIIQG